MKKIISLMLASVMMLVLIAACSSSGDPATPSPTSGSGATTAPGTTPADYPTLRVFLASEITPDKDMVAEAISEITREEIGANIELVMYGPGEFRDRLPLLLASNEPMDIGFDAGWMGYLGRARSGAYLDITELLETRNQELYDTINPLLWQGVQVDGGTYAVPSNKEAAEQWVLYAQTEWLEDAGFDPETITELITSLEDAEILLEALEEYPDRPGFMITPQSGHMTLYHHQTHAYVSANQLISVPFDDPETLINFYESDRYRDFVYLMRDWYNKGYIVADVATLENYDRFDQPDGSQLQGVQLVSYTPFNEVSWATTYGHDVTPIPVTPVTITNNSTSGSVNGIYQKSQHPELALDFMQLLNTNADVKNLITYGIEGRHYNLVDGKVEFVPNHRSMYIGENWRIGNMFISHLLAEDADDKYEQFDAFNESAIEAPNLGFQVDDSSISSQLAATTAVIAEYRPLLNVGAVDPDEYLSRFITALRNAGSETILDELQSQYDDWRAQQ